MQRQSTVRIVPNSEPTPSSCGSSLGCADRDVRSSVWISPGRLKRWALEPFHSSQATAFLACARPEATALKRNMSLSPRGWSRQCRRVGGFERGGGGEGAFSRKRVFKRMNLKQNGRRAGWGKGEN